MREIMTLRINCKDTHQIHAHGTFINMICFDGSAEGEFFNGIILPGGVDTQKYYSDGTGGLSARYALKGTDFEGKECMMFIENTAEKDAPKTNPKIYTDSEALAFLETAKLYGTLDFSDGLKIHIFEE